MAVFLLDFLVKPGIIFVTGYLLLRIAGKKAVSEMNRFDLVFLVVIGNTLAEPLVTHNTLKAVGYSLAFVLLYLLFSYLVLYNKLRWLLTAEPTVLIRNGDIDELGLRKARITVNDLLSQLRLAGYTKPTDVEFAVMENMGEVSFIPKSHARPLQPSDLLIQPAPVFIPIPVVLDGEIVEQNLSYLKKSREWLRLQLALKQINMDQDLPHVTLAALNQEGGLDVDINTETKTSTST